MPAALINARKQFQQLRCNVKKTTRIDFYTKRAADAFLKQLTLSGAVKAYTQTLSSSRYQVRFW
jgi:hypothetical protein